MNAWSITIGTCIVELRELVKMHAVHQESNEEPLSYDEVLIVKVNIDIHVVRSEIMCVCDVTFRVHWRCGTRQLLMPWHLWRASTWWTLPAPLIERPSKRCNNNIHVILFCDEFDYCICLQLTRRGHSRVPVYQGHRQNVCGILLVKRLLGLDPDETTPISTLQGAHTPPPSCLTTTPLYEMLNIFQTGKSKSCNWLWLSSLIAPSLSGHLALVYEQKSELSEVSQPFLSVHLLLALTTSSSLAWSQGNHNSGRCHRGTHRRRDCWWNGLVHWCSQTNNGG